MLLRRLFATTTGAIVSKGAAILTALLLFRQLPTADMGRYTAVLTLVGFCAILGNAGLNPLTTREIARRGETGMIWWASLAPLRLLLALGAYILLVIIAIFVPALVDTRLALIAGLLLVPGVLADALAATLTGLGRAALASWLDALGNLVGLAATLALLLLWHVGVLALALLAVALAVWALIVNGLALVGSWRIMRFPAFRWAASFFSLRRQAWWRSLQARSSAASASPLYSKKEHKILPFTSIGTADARNPELSPGASEETTNPPARVFWRNALGGEFIRRWDGVGADSFPRPGARGLFSAWKQALAAALPLGLAALAATLYFRVDTLFLSAARGGQAVAYYSAPYQIVESFWLISTSWNAIALPVLARHYSPRFVERSIALLLSVGVPASLVIAFRAEDVARLVFGRAYLPAALPLRLVIWVVPILFSYVPLVTALFVHDRQRHVLLVLLVNLALVLVLDALLIPPYGVLGASIATLVVEAGALIGYLLLAQRASLGVIWARGLIQPALICLPLITMLMIGQSLPFMFVLPAAVLLWAALFGLLRPWEDWRMASSIHYPRRWWPHERTP